MRPSLFWRPSRFILSICFQLPLMPMWQAWFEKVVSAYTYSPSRSLSLLSADSGIQLPNQGRSCHTVRPPTSGTIYEFCTDYTCSQLRTALGELVHNSQHVQQFAPDVQLCTTSKSAWWGSWSSLSGVFPRSIIGRDDAQVSHGMKYSQARRRCPSRQLRLPCRSSSVVCSSTV